jgi:four helix bundle protein
MLDTGLRGKEMSYKELKIWQLAREVVIDIHKMTLKCLPKFELYEEGSQIRRSIKSVKSNIVEGYGRRRYKQDFIRFLTYAIASCDETTDHLETLYETRSLKDKGKYEDLHESLQILGKQINLFIQSVEKQHKTER